MSRLENIKLTLWNPHTKQCLGRTGDSWLKLIGFYIVFYSCLAAIWSLYFFLFRLTISDKYPKYQLDDSLIGSNPGVGLRPRNPRERVESALISYRSGSNGDYAHWVEALASYLNESDPISANNQSEILRDCSKVGAKSEMKQDGEFSDAICPFDNSSIPPECTLAQNFSFPLGKPCLLLKLNRIYGWKPEPFVERPDSFPKGIQFTPGNLFITCEGQHDADKEHLGPLSYHPPNGIETKYYPFLNQPGYQSPYVMVHFKEPKLNTLIYVECKAWAKNIEQDRSNKKGLTTFELFIEREEESSSKGETESNKNS